MEVYCEDRTFYRLANCRSIGRVRHSTNADICVNLDAASNCDIQAHRYGAPNRNLHVDTY